MKIRFIVNRGMTLLKNAGRYAVHYAGVVDLDSEFAHNGCRGSLLVNSRFCRFACAEAGHVGASVLYDTDAGDEVHLVHPRMVPPQRQPSVARRAA